MNWLNKAHNALSKVENIMRKIDQRISASVVAALTLTICFMGAPCLAFGRSELSTPDVRLTSGPNPSNVGQLVTFTATVSSQGGPTPQGSITISEYPPGSQQPIIYGIKTLTNGVGVVTTDNLTEGRHVIVATYGGEDGVYNGAQSQVNQVVNEVPINVSAEPLQTIIPVHFDPSTGSITVGSTVYPGTNPGLHLLALKRQPDSSHLDAPDLVRDQIFLDATSANQFLQDVLASTPDALLLVNGVGNYEAPLSSLGKGLTSFGAYPDLQGVKSAIPFIFIGNGGRNPQTALQRGYSTRPLDGYLAQDSKGNYTFIQTDFVRYDLTPDGTIKVGNTTYPAANAKYKNGSCDAAVSDSFHLVVVNRESPDVVIANIAYCTRQTPAALNQMASDLNGVNSENELVFIATNGHPIPADWNFGTDGDARVYPLAQQIARLGGYWETMVYLTPNDTYSLVGAPSPGGTAQARQQARESSSVYPADGNGKAPTGELHGVLARGRGNLYSPLNADPGGYANLDLYGILAQTPVAFPPLTGAKQVAAFQAINQKLCGSLTCNVRNQYGDLSINIGTTYQTPLQSMNKDAAGNDCTDPQNANLPYCAVRAQLLNEFKLVSNIRAFYDNVNGLWSSSGTVTLASQLGAYDNIKATLQAPADAPARSLAGPLVSLFLGLGKELPVVGKVYGLADTFFNFLTELTTDKNGNQTIDLTSTVGQLETQASNQFIAQANTTGTLFDFIYQDWGKLKALGTNLASATGPGSPWYWSSTATSQMLQAMTPAVQQAVYQSIMPAAYGIGSYLPTARGACVNEGPLTIWGEHPLWQQPYGYVIYDNDFNGCPLGLPHTVIPFPPVRDLYIPYTYPNDPENPDANDPTTATILADHSWLGISTLTTPKNSGPSGHYNPPDAKVLTRLFTPLSQDGLGVYRPAFFEGWPFPHVTCDPVYNKPHEGGCDWGAAKPVTGPSPGPLGASITMQAAQIASNGNEVDVRLTVFNNGTEPANSITLTSITLSTLAGSGQATLLNSSMPMLLGDLVRGDSTEVVLKLDIPPSITKLSITEAASADMGQPQLVQLSQGQALYPQR